MSLAEKAAELAGRNGDGPQTGTSPELSPPPASPSSEQLPEVDIPAPPPEGPEQVPVHMAWSRVMGEIRAVAKNETPSSGTRFDYRGVDTALNVFGPACRLHGVLVIPTRVQASYRDTTTTKGNATRECTAVVTYRIYGPMGDYIEAEAAGESLDSGDKGSAKAQAVALRTLLYHAGLVPTRDADPDANNIERGEALVRSAVSYRNEVLEDGVSLQRCQQIYRELEQNRMLGHLVTNGLGEDETIGALVGRIGTEIRNGNR